MISPLQIANGTIQIIQQADPNTTNLVYATWVLAIGTISLAIATIIGIIKTRKDAQNSLLEAQQTNRLLSLELRTKFKPSLNFDAQVLRHKADDLHHAEFLCRMVNNGNTALRNIVINYFTSYEEINPAILVSKETEIKKIPHEVEGTLEPTRYHQLIYALNMDTKKDVWIAIWINYEYLSGIKEEACAIYYFMTPKGDGRFETLGSVGFHWYSDNDFQKVRK